MKQLVVFLLLIFCYISVVTPVAKSMQKRSFAVRLGHLPSANLLNLVGADFKPVLAQFTVAKVLFYYGTLVDRETNRQGDRPEYYQMFKMLETAIKLDPYNQDPYYFLQATYTWELNRAKDVNAILKYGMKYRTWDYWLPFYAGFNAAYFLNDRQEAGKYYSRAAELSGASRYASLGSRYFYQAGRSDLAESFLLGMIKTARTDVIRKTYQRRLQAVRAVRVIERARDRYRETFGHLPDSLPQLLATNFLEVLPVDPYGGEFSLDEDGKVVTSSNLFSEENDSGRDETRTHDSGN